MQKKTDGEGALVLVSSCDMFLTVFCELAMGNPGVKSGTHLN